MVSQHNNRLKQQVLQSFVARAEELTGLLTMLADDGPAVIFVHGIGGIGKSTLLDVFTLKAQARGAVVVRLDCRIIQPSETGFLDALNSAIGDDFSTLRETTARLSSLGPRVILALDTYEVYRMQDTWLRQTFIPSLNDNVRVLLVGREAPVSSWFTSPGWHGLFQSIRLKPLTIAESEDLLRRSGVGAPDISRVVHFAHGHPLALKLAAAAIAERPHLTLKEVESQHVVAELTRLYLADVQDPQSREALEAASVIRRTTRSLLEAMLPHTAPNDTFYRLKALPFVESGSDGLIIHDMVQQAIATELRAVDPDKYFDYRRAAWKQLRTEFPTAGRTAIWRYTADMIYLIEHPAIHEAFFPSDTHLYAVEPATPQDEPAICAITLAQDGPEMLAALLSWWQRLPEAFYVARDRSAAVSGFYCMFHARELDQQELEAHPITRHWWQHLRENPIPPDQEVLFSVRWIAAETGEDPSPVQAALWLDIKRTYMEYPQTRRIYNIVHDAAYWVPIMAQLGFRTIPLATPTLDGKRYVSVVNDFGPGLVPGWMAGLVNTQFGLQPELRLDCDARELVHPDGRITLTPLEFELIHYLFEREGKAVSRTEILNEVWGYDYEGGSNVVDAMVHSLRKKLGAFAVAIETVTGVGYRFRAK